MNKPCNNCKKEIHYYAGFCDHCETIQLRNEPKYTETKIGHVRQTWFGSPIKIEKMPNNTVIHREYHKYGRIVELWIDMNKNYISIDKDIDYDAIQYDQTWIDKPKELSSFSITPIKLNGNEIEVSNWYKKYSQDGYNSFIELYEGHCNYYFSYGMICDKTVYMVKPKNENVDYPGYIKTVYYDKSKQIMSTHKYGNYREVKDKTYESESGEIDGYDLIIGEYYNPDGKFIGKVDETNRSVVIEYDQNGKLIRPEVSYGYFDTNGFFNKIHLNDYSMSSTYERIIKTHEKRKRDINREVQQEKEYNEWIQLRNSFDPTEYEKKCSECFESVKLPAKICHYCRKQFSEVEIQDAIDDKFNELHPKP